MDTGDSGQLTEVGPPVEPMLSPVRWNAARHGILSVAPVIPWFESEEDWLAWRDGFFEDFKPEGAVQMALVDRAAAIMWRMLRVQRYERESVVNELTRIASDLRMSAMIAQEEFSEELTPRRRRQMERAAMERLVPSDATLNKVIRYEARLQRWLLQTLHEITRLKRLKALSSLGSTLGTQH
jgi:hypothetical protein